jgi:hypothetical protein
MSLTVPENYMRVSLTIPENYMRTFDTNWGHTVQQQMAKLGRLVTIDAYTGKEKVYTDMDQVAFRERKQRLGKSNPQEVTANKRKSTKKDLICQIIFDRSDTEFLGQLMEPTSEVQVEMGYAFERRLDVDMVAALSGTVYGGADPYVTAITLPSTQKIAATYNYDGSVTSRGLTPDKLVRAQTIIGDNNLSMTQDQWYLAMKPKQREDLFQYVKSAPNAPYANMIGEWLNNPSKPLFGFTVVESTALAVSAGDIATNLIWCKRGIFAAPSKMEVKIDILPETEHAKQISAYGQMGFMRRYEERVIEIACDQSP